MKLTLLVFISFIGIQLKGQDFLIKIDTTGQTCYPFSNIFNKETDTTSYHLIFENYFEEDTISVSLNDRFLFEKVITTDKSLGKAESFIIDDIKTNSFVNVKINRSPVINLPLNKEKKYVIIRYLEMYERMTVCYFTFPPFYE